MSKNLQDYDGNIWNIMCFQKNNTIHASLNDFGRSYYVPNLYENFRNYYLLYSFKATKWEHHKIKFNDSCLMYIVNPHGLCTFF